MSLTATQPDQELIDGLSLDAAWKHAALMKQERDAALRRADESKRNMDRAVSLKNGYIAAIMSLVDKYYPHKADHPVLSDLVDELYHLYGDMEVV